MTELKTIAVAGAGVMGSQVSWQAAWHGKRVFVFDAFEADLAKGRQFHQEYGREFMAERGASQADVDRAQARLSYSTDLATALEDADVLIEQVPEDIKIKQDFWGKASKLAPEKTIFCTNTSSLLPSAMVPFVDRPEKS